MGVERPSVATCGPHPSATFNIAASAGCTCTRAIFDNQFSLPLMTAESLALISSKATQKLLGELLGQYRQAHPGAALPFPHP